MQRAADQFFTQWFDTAYPSRRREHAEQAEDHRPRPERPGLPCAQVTPASPNGAERLVQEPRRRSTWSGFPRRPRRSRRRPAASTRRSRPTARMHAVLRRSPRRRPRGAISGTRARLGDVQARRDRRRRRPRRSRRPRPTAERLVRQRRRRSRSPPSDATSGVASTEYTIDGGAVQTYSAPFAVATEGAHTLAVLLDRQRGQPSRRSS